MAPRACEFLLHFLQQNGAIGEARQVVMPGHISDLRFGPLLRGDILVNRDPAAVRHRPVMDGKHAPVAHRDLDIIRLALADLRQTVFHVVVGMQRPAASRYPRLENGTQRHAGFDQIAREPGELGVTVVANNQALVAVEHAQAMGHVPERGIEQKILCLQLGLALAKRCGALLHQLIESAIELLKLLDHQRDRAIGAMAIVIRLLVGLRDEREQRLEGPLRRSVWPLLQAVWQGVYAPACSGTSAIVVTVIVWL